MIPLERGARKPGARVEGALHVPEAVRKAFGSLSPAVMRAGDRSGEDTTAFSDFITVRRRPLVRR